LAAVLLCQPQLTTFPATVYLDSQGNLSVYHAAAPATAVGNLPYIQAANVLNEALLSALSTIDDGLGTVLASTAAQSLFLNSSASSAPGLAPLSQSAINANMNKFMASATKAYAKGFVNSSFTSTINVPASIQVQRLVITTDETLWIATIVLFVLEVVALLAVSFLGAPSKLLFDLKNVARACFSYAETNPQFKHEMMSSEESLGLGEESYLMKERR
jgi:hypothetical protein